jgi:hypothetical protein
LIFPEMLGFAPPLPTGINVILYYSVKYTVIIIIMAVQPFVRPWPLFQFLDPIRSR